MSSKKKMTTKSAKKAGQISKVRKRTSLKILPSSKHRFRKTFKKGTRAPSTSKTASTGRSKISVTVETSSSGPSGRPSGGSSEKTVYDKKIRIKGRPKRPRDAVSEFESSAGLLDKRQRISLSGRTFYTTILIIILFFLIGITFISYWMMQRYAGPVGGPGPGGTPWKTLETVITSTRTTMTPGPRTTTPEPPVDPFTLILINDCKRKTNSTFWQCLSLSYNYYQNCQKISCVKAHYAMFDGNTKFTYQSLRTRIYYAEKDEVCGDSAKCIPIIPHSVRMLCKRIESGPYPPRPPEKPQFGNLTAEPPSCMLDPDQPFYNMFGLIRQSHVFDCNNHTDSCDTKRKLLMTARFRNCIFDQENGGSYCPGLPLCISFCKKCDNYDPDTINTSSTTSYGAKVCKGHFPTFTGNGCTFVCPRSPDPNGTHLLPNGVNCFNNRNQNDYCLFGLCLHLMDCTHF